MSTLPRLGQTITVRGVRCTILKLRPFGTLDVVTPEGRAFRVTGLPYRLCLACGGAMTESCGCVDSTPPVSRSRSV